MTISVIYIFQNELHKHLTENPIIKSNTEDITIILKSKPSYPHIYHQVNSIKLHENTNTIYNIFGEVNIFFRGVFDEKIYLIIKEIEVIFANFISLQPIYQYISGKIYESLREISKDNLTNKISLEYKVLLEMNENV